MGRKKVPITLPGVDDLFTSQGERDGSAMGGVSDIPLAAIDPFPGHPFQVRDDEEMERLAESIAENGVLVPLTVRTSGAERYEVDEVYQRVDLVQFESPHKTAAQCFGGRTVTAGVFAATLVGFAGGGDGGLQFDAFRGFTGSQFAGESVDFPPQLCVVCGVGYLRHDGNALKGGAEALNLFG